MKIISSNCWAEQYKLSEGYSVGHEQNIEHYDNVFLTLETEEDITGWGMAAPDSVITGEDVDSVLTAYKNHIEACVKGENPFYFSRLYEELRDEVPGQSSALAMVERLSFPGRIRATSSIRSWRSRGKTR